MTKSEIVAIFDKKLRVVCVSPACDHFGVTPPEFSVVSMEINGFRSYDAECTCGANMRIASGA